jgi:SAM-dependent methyltransferase
MIDQQYYRRRFYSNYLTTHAGAGAEDVCQGVNSRAPYLKSLIAKWFPSERDIRILDLGCGYGAFLYLLKKAGYYELEGIDTSSEQVAGARRLGLNFVREGNLLEALKNSRNCSYDFLIAFDVLEHFSKDEILVFANEAYRVLKSGGRLLIHVPNGEAIFPGAVFFGDLTHETCFTRQSLRQLVNVSGFSSLRVIEDMPTVHGVKSLLRYILWKIFRTMFRVIYVAETGDTGKDLVLSQNLLAVVVK